MPQQVDLKLFLCHSYYIDCNTPSIQKKAAELSTSTAVTNTNQIDHSLQIAKACFEFVRDDIKHSMDYGLNNTTCKASDVLKRGHGFCYAKSHLLAALLRANGIPTALCYQRLTIADSTNNHKSLTHCLHGLNAIYLPTIMGNQGFGQIGGWYRIDPRGYKPGVRAEFTPPHETLAFAIKSQGERDIIQPNGGLFAKPLACVTDVLESYTSYQDVANNLPDLPSQ